MALSVARGLLYDRAMRPSQSGKKRFPAALHGGPVDRIPVGNAVSVATADLMEACGAGFPEAHRDPEVMAELAAEGGLC